MRAEREAAINLAAARAAEADARQSLAHIEARRSEARRVLAPVPGSATRVAELRHVALLMEQLDQRATHAGDLVATTEHVASEKQLHLGQSVKDRRVLDRLKQRQLEGWMREDMRAERDVMDTIGRARFADMQDSNLTTED